MLPFPTCMEICHACSTPLGTVPFETCVDCGTRTHRDCAVMLSGCVRIDCARATASRLRAVAYLRARAAQDISGYGGITRFLRAWLLVSLGIGTLIGVQPGMSLLDGLSFVPGAVFFLMGLARLGRPDPSHAYFGLVIPAAFWAITHGRLQRARWVEQRLSARSIARDELLGMLTDHDIDDAPAETQLRFLQLALWALGGLLIYSSETLLDYFWVIWGNPRFAAWSVLPIAAVIWFAGKSVKTLHQSLLERIEQEKKARKLAHLLRFAIATLMRRDLLTADPNWRFSVTDGTRTPPGSAPPPEPGETSWERWSLARPTIIARRHAGAIAAACLAGGTLLIGRALGPTPQILLRGSEIPPTMREHATYRMMDEGVEILWLFSKEWPHHLFLVSVRGLGSCDNRDVRKPFQDFYRLSWPEIWDLRILPSANEESPTRILFRDRDRGDHEIVLRRTPDRRDLELARDVHSSWMKSSYWAPGSPNLRRHEGADHACSNEMLPVPDALPPYRFPPR